LYGPRGASPQVAEFRGGRAWGGSQRARKEGGMAKVLRCGEFMVKCPYVVHGATEEEVLREAAKHLAEVHHIKELTPGIAATVKRNIRTE